nr:neurexin-4 [Leptinotarsa decemlineata]
MVALYVYLFLCISTNLISAQYYDEYECNTPLFTRAALSATSSMSGRGPENAVLYGGNAWSSKDNDFDQYLIFDLGQVMNLTRIWTQGRPHSNEYVMEYQISYGTNGLDYANYKESGGDTMMFRGNVDGDTVHKNEFEVPIIAQWIRINPTRWRDRISLRVELFGCDYEADDMYFNGTSLLKYDLLREPISALKESIKFRFKTSAPNGVVLYSRGTQGDYIALQLQDNRMLLNIDLGSGTVTSLCVGSLLDDNLWHDVVISRNRRDILFSVDRVVVYDKIKGEFQRLNLNRGFYVGGVPIKKKNFWILGFFLLWLAFKKRKSAWSPKESTYFEKLILDLGSRYEIRSMATQGRGSGSHEYVTEYILDYSDDGEGWKSFHDSEGEIEMAFNYGETFKYEKINTLWSCPEPQIIPVTFKTQHSFAKLKGYEGMSSLNSSFAFRTFEENGLMLYHAFSTNGYVAVTLNNQVVFNVDSRPMMTTRLLKIVTGSLYLIAGGVNAPLGYSNTIFPGFVGCMRTIRIDGNNKLPTDWTKEEYCCGEDVVFDACQMTDRCNPNPCQHGGVCKQNSMEFFCVCKGTGYGGAVCHTSINSLSCLAYKNVQAVGQRAEIKIDVDGSGPLAAFPVTCEFYADGRVATFLHHSNEETTPVDGFQEPGEFSQDIHYEADDDQIAALINRSLTCRQHIQYACRGARLMGSPSEEMNFRYMLPEIHLLRWGPHQPGPPARILDVLSASQRPVDERSDLIVVGLVVDVLRELARFLEAIHRGSFLVAVVEEGGYSPVCIELTRDRERGEGSAAVDGALDEREGRYTLGPLICEGDDLFDNVVTFRTSDATINLPTFDMGHSGDIYFEFRTAVEDAVLFHSTGPTDHIKLSIVNGNQLQFEYQAGSGPMAVIRYDSYMCDCRWTAFKGPICADEIGVNMRQSSMVRYDFDGSFRSTISEHIRVGFTTTNPKGFLLGFTSNMTGEYMTIMVSNSGSLRIVFDFGFERQEVHYPDKYFGYGQYHDLIVSRKNGGSTLVMQVDGNEPKEFNFNIKASADAQFNNIQYMYIGKNESMTEGFIGCISRVEFDDIYPLKLLFQQQGPGNVKSLGTPLTEDYCGVEPITHPPDIVETRPPLSVDPDKLRKAYNQVDSAILGSVLAIVFLALIILLIIIGRYLHRHKGEYLTQEDAGADSALDPDTAVVHGTTGHHVQKKKEWFI